MAITVAKHKSPNNNEQQLTRNRISQDLSNSNKTQTQKGHIIILTKRKCKKATE